MPDIAELQIGRKVTALVDHAQHEGLIVGRRINNRIEGYMAPRGDIWPQPEEGPDMVQVSFPMRLGTSEWVTTGLTCFPGSVELV